DFDAERFYRDAKILQIYEGTTEIQKNIIGRELLGKGLS
ncbi:acyl-CoA dehydrogenase family protein, partial [Halorientalis pallida]